MYGGCSSVWLERLPVEEDVEGSNPFSHPNLHFESKILRYELLEYLKNATLLRDHQA